MPSCQSQYLPKARGKLLKLEVGTENNLNNKVFYKKCLSFDYVALAHIVMQIVILISKLCKYMFILNS